jgi:oxygen-independent coproporphyrinogen-3 oxidase
MCQGELDIAAFEERFGIDFRDCFAEDLRRLQALVADGLVTVDASRVRASDRGRLLLRIIAACFDRYLHQATAQPARFSKAI